MRETHKLIPDSMCDFRAYYDSIAQWLPNHCKVIEVGVADGFSSIYLAEALENLNKHYELVMVDSMDYGKSDQLTEIIKNVLRSGCDGIRVMPMDSLNASCKFPDGWADFVFIDASHLYEQTKADIRLGYKKVKDNGVLAGHDFNSPEVNRAVMETIPKDMLGIVRTEKDYGIWSCPKLNKRDIC